MTPPRFHWTDHGLLLDTAVPLTSYQQERAASFAIPVYRQRYDNLPPGDKRDVVGRIIRALRDKKWTMRAVQACDSEKDIVIH